MSSLLMLMSLLKSGALGAGGSPSIAALTSSGVADAAQFFSPTIYGQVAANGDVVESDAIDVAFDPDTFAFATGVVGIWVIATATNCYIRVGADGGGDGTATDNWINSAGADQGDPGSRTGTGTTVFELGVVPDTVTIDHTDTDINPTTAFAVLGSSYTDNSAFSPTQDTKYGRQATCSSTQSGVGTTTEEGRITFAVTFSRSGYFDYTITFTAWARAIADVLGA